LITAARAASALLVTAARRGTAWIKYKHRRRRVVVIAGWRERPGAPEC
jgi:hypothetical protein